MNCLPKTVRLFSMDGIADGRWICELSNWTGKAYKIPRSMLGQSKNREDLQSTGVYLLLGRSDELGGKEKMLHYETLKVICIKSNTVATPKSRKKWIKL